MKAGARFGERFRDARTAARLSQDVLADRLGITKSAISQWELGNKAPRFELWASIRRELGASLDQLICGDSLPRSGALRSAEQSPVYQIGKVSPADHRSRQIVQLFGQLSESQQKAMVELMRSIVPTQADHTDRRRQKKAEPRA